MFGSKVRFSSVVVALAAILFASAYLFKAKEPILQIVSPDKMIAHTTFSFPADTKFADSVMKSSIYAVVLERGEHTTGNANSLESLRGWAADQFHADPRFLHPVILPKARAGSTFITASAYSLFAAPYYFATQTAAQFIGNRIAEYCTTPSFVAFRDNYVGLFGSSSEAATLLARYQSDRALAAINPLLTLIYALLTLVLSPLLIRPVMRLSNFWRAPFGPEAGAKSAAYFAYYLGALSLYYAAQSIIVESTAAPATVAAIISGGAAAYVLCPVRLLVDSEEIMLMRSTMHGRAVSVFGFVFFSVLSIQMLTWIKQGVLTEPDPISRLVSAFSGDFIHDSLVVKRWISIAIAVSWSIGLLSVVRMLSRRGLDSSREVAKKLAGLGSK